MSIKKIDELEKPILISPSSIKCEINKNGEVITRYTLALYEYPPRIIKNRKTKHEREMEEDLIKFQKRHANDYYIGFDDYADY